ncbi:hypothetical protein [Fibrella forsythiae]|uniref:Uncharacterized protein n=1 Tax=Fibrella forsythiae TaxID=2817061 RepID=A0ABS3JP70_9BACT|nr:hypothetical protein [Fibrella forsythiae]MBO0951211.1 hypothetical protein [Fibrella forsythiae]
MIVNVPTTGKPAKTGYTSVLIAAQATALMSQYGPFVDQSCRLNNVPEFLLKSIVLIENFDLKADSVNRASGRPQYKEATGLGQHMMYSATDIISRAAKKKLLNDEKRAVLKKQLGTRLDYIEKNIGTKTYVVTQDDLKDPEFNLMLTGMYLSQLLGEELEKGRWRVDKVALRYNQGYYFKMPANTATTDLLLAGISGEAYAYVRKICGKDGFLEQLTA